MAHSPSFVRRSPQGIEHSLLMCIIGSWRTSRSLVISPRFGAAVEREGWGMEPLVEAGSRSLEGKTRCPCDRHREEWGTAVDEQGMWLFEN